MCPPSCRTCGPYGPGTDECCSRELRAGVMYTNCECWKLNGLQDQCPRSMCQGGCCGLTGNGAPSCCPASYPLKFAAMTHGLDNRPMRCYATAACCPKRIKKPTFSNGFCC